MTRKSICIIAGSFPARSETFVREHVLGLALRGWQVHVIAGEIGVGINDNELCEIDAIGVKRHYIDFFSGTRFARLCQQFFQCVKNPTLLKYYKGKDVWSRAEMLWSAQVAKLICHLNPVVLHIHYGAYAGPLSYFKLPKKVITTWHGFDANIKPKRLGFNMYHTFFRKEGVHTVGSDFMVKRLQILGCSIDNISHIPMGVDLASFPFIDRRSQNSDILQIISVGRLSDEKGHQDLIQAIALLDLWEVPVNLRIIGDGPLKSGLLEKIEEANLTSRVSLLGAQTNEVVRSEFAKSDLFVLACRIGKDGAEETQGVAIIEAQATGLPIVVTDVGGVSESLQPGVTGELIKSRDVEGIANAIQVYAIDKNKRINHGQAGSRFVRENFSIENMLDKLEKIYLG
ncbi:glycosyltransferase [Vibrio sp. 10N.261.51.C6]|uniref:glycosyltransferase n=1 Tax=Vibrio sp. 10N.261.51.C6 TaxID=3229676 RepID=UPI0035533B95